MKTENRFEIKFNMSNIELIKFKENIDLLIRCIQQEKLHHIITIQPI